MPDKVCIIDTFGDRERGVTYAMLDQRMDRVAAMLARLGVTAGERVAMVVGNRAEFIEFFLVPCGWAPFRSSLRTEAAGRVLDGH